MTTPKQPGPKWPDSSGGGREPRCRKDGRELFYRDDHRLYAVEVGGAPEAFAVGRVAPPRLPSRPRTG